MPIPACNRAIHETRRPYTESVRGHKKIVGWRDEIVPFCSSVPLPRSADYPHRHKPVASSNRAYKACIKVEAGLEHFPLLGRARKATSGFCVHYQVQRSFPSYETKSYGVVVFPVWRANHWSDLFGSAGVLSL